ncbi:MAG: PDZ domain-containing protein [Verrucomicrobia bacterium]|nr:MAG: PDZ domain-containing protein [Verrucomicrobiota bacterium]TAE86548.1 MAG: PDZ domain-containing protein [Verrucomicrobiota bacterium]TAF24243.1 MAG: PDZ domain-containing protein [Verrucomicrobiota bacterium]
MRPLQLIALVLLASCERPPAPQASPAAPPTTHVSGNPLASVVRISSTQQAWNPTQPWEKLAPGKRRALGAIVAENQVLTTAEMATDTTYIELESTDGKKLAQAQVIAVDYEANLALLGLADPTRDHSFFDGVQALAIAERPEPGDPLDIIQLEENGTPLITTGDLRSIDVVSNFLPGQFFLTYEVKASMQSAANSFSLPVLRDGKLAGILTSYDAKDQLSDVVATDIIARFVRDAADGDYAGFPSLGISTSRTEDPNFRLWLKLPADGGGLYVSSVRAGSAAEKAGLKKGDVILRIDNQAIDRLGYFEDSHYGRLYWSHLVRGAKSAGDRIRLDILRQGKATHVDAILDRRDEADQLVPAYAFGKAPAYLIKGGLLFQELTRPQLEAFGEDWQSIAPLNLLDVYENPEKYESRGRRIVFLSGVIATPATVGYEPLRHLIVTKVNGTDIRDMKSLIQAFQKPGTDGLHQIEFDEEKFTVHLDESVSSAVDRQLLQRGLTKLSQASD